MNMNLTRPQKLIYDMEKFTGGTIAVLCGAMLVRGEKPLVEIKRAASELCRLNDALRIRIDESEDEVSQVVCDYAERDFSVLRFDTRDALDSYAEKYAKLPLDLHGDLCEINIVILPKQYGLLVKMHHLIGDAWSFALIGTQFNRLLNGETIETYSYADYVASENSYIQGKRYEKDKAYFVDLFKRCDEVTYLNEKNVDTSDACRKTFVIGKADADRIKAYAKAKDTSAFMLFAAALSVYINRTKMNAERFYIGTAVLNRNGAKEQNTAGMFVNTAPMLIELDNDSSFAENLASIEETVLSVFRHQRFNYGDLLTAIRKDYGFNEKLYDVILSYQNATVAGADVETVWYHSGMQSESLQMHIDDRDRDGIYRIHYDYLTEKFSAQEIEGLHAHLVSLLFDAIRNDAKKLYELDILPPAEKQRLLHTFNDTAVEYPKDRCVHQLFEAQVAKTPHKTALIAADKTLTYAELNAEANRIAHSLVEKGIGKNDIIAFQVSRKSCLVALMLGILKSGASYMPIDPAYPKDRVDYMVKDIGAKFCVADEMVQALAEHENSDNLRIYNSQQEIFCVLHTSGSTGQPKGAAIKHQNMVNFIYSNMYLLDGIEHVIAINTVTFDVFEMDTIFALTTGTTCVLADEEQQFNQAAFEAMMGKYKNCLFWATPTKIGNYINNSATGDFFAHINCYVVGGEVLKPELLDRIRGLNKNTKIYTVYGPTETLIYSTLVDVSATNDISIGHPIANTQIYIVDRFMQIVPIGVVGELCIAGDGVGAGYLNRPELTAERFADNPFGAGKLYKTGDLAYWREDGNIAYVGRNDFQVKIRGLRIELGEIENAVCGMDGIAQAVVVVRKDNDGRQLILAFYTGAELDAKEIRRHIGKKLPKYMLPHAYIHLDAMPLTASGKINRKALPVVSFANFKKENYVAPKTAAEKALASAVEAALSVERVSITDDFFDLGGDSLKAIELISRLEKLGYYIDTKTIFACDTLQELSQKLKLVQDSYAAVVQSGDLLATAAQLRIYTAESVGGGSVYHVPYAFKTESVDIDRLQHAVDGLVARHESLRTHFENRDGVLIQVVDEAARCRVETLDSTDIGAFIRPFDLGVSPLLRVGVYKNIVMVDMHHIIADGGSMPVFFGELNALYMGRTMAEPPVQYRQFAMQAHPHAESEKYWMSVYGDEVPVLELRTDYRRGQKQSFNGSSIYASAEIDLHREILAFCRAQSITPYVFYMGGFNILLSKFSGCEDVVVGMPVSGRDAAYLGTIGMFVNTVCLRNKPVGTKTVSAFLQEVKENTVNAICYQDYPYGELVKKLNIYTVDRNPLFDVMFAYQSEEMTEVVFGDEKAEPMPIPTETSKYDFSFTIMPREDRVVMLAEYCTDLYKANTVQRLLDGYKQILRQMLDGQMPLGDISAIVACERDRLLHTFNDTAAEYPKDKCVHQLFEAQVAKTPHKTALIAADKTLTYAELNAEANRIAHALIESGVGVGDIVAFALPRKSYLVAAMLGILKAGAAYLPLDPSYPQDRIDYMLADSKAKWVIRESNIQALLANAETSTPHVAISSEQLCYCIYTSGSTGMPKGVSVCHRNVVNFCSNNKKIIFKKNWLKHVIKFYPPIM